jgi:hypothetical protein
MIATMTALILGLMIASAGAFDTKDGAIGTPPSSFSHSIGCWPSTRDEGDP